MLKLNGVVITPTIFPDKTSQVWRLPDGLVKGDKENVVEWDFESEAEFIHLAQLRELLPHSVTLHLPYLPYARQDKGVANDVTFALTTFMRLLNGLRFSSVEIFDAHNPSYVRGRIDRVRVTDPIREIYYAIGATQADVVCFPDEGAKQRYSDLLHKSQRVIHATKVRNLVTGEITELTLHGDAFRQRVLIVDDLCDGGMTFIKLAKLLERLVPKEIHLYVSHGLFTKGVQVLRDAGIKRIFTRQGEVI